MTVFISTFLCILGVFHASGLMFMCSYNRFIVNIGLQCTGGTKISIVEAWGFKSNTLYSCTNNNTATLPEVKYGLRTSMWHRIFTHCAGESQCKFLLYPEQQESHGIGIRYECLPDNRFIRFCTGHSTSISYPYHVNMIFKHAGDAMNKTCRCDVEANGKFQVSLTQFPTNSGYLKMKTRSEVTNYRNKLFIDDNEAIQHGNDDKNWQTFVVTYDVNEGAPFILIKFKFAVNGEYWDVSVNCESNGKKQQPAPENLDSGEEPEQESESVLGYVVTSIGTAVAILFTVACVAVVYHRYAKKREGTKLNKKFNVPFPRRKFKRNMQASVSVNCNESLSHSYAEIGSISDYRHYVMPDDTSQQSFRMKISLKKLAEEAEPRGCPATPNSKPREVTATRAERNTATLKDINISDVTDVGNSATVRDMTSVHLRNEKSNKEQCLVLAETTGRGKQDENTDLPKVASVHLRNEKTNQDQRSVATDKDKLDENADLPMVSGAEQKLDRENKTISREHYDPSGYLDLDITEKTSHQYLQKWIKEIYTVEQKARQAKEDGNGEETLPVAHRRVLILKNDPVNKQPDRFYSNADDHKIMFSDEETLFH